MSWCLTFGLDLFASAAPPPPPPSPVSRVTDIRSVVAEKDFWVERCAESGLNPDSPIGSKFRPLEAICGYLRRIKSPPVKSTEEEETIINRILRSGILRKRKEEISEDDRSRSNGEGDDVGNLLNKDRFVEALGKDGTRSKSWNGKHGYDEDVWSPIPLEEVPIDVDDDPVDKRSEGSWENRSSEQDPSSDLERFLESKRSDEKMTREKNVHGVQGTSHPRWSVYFIG